jgi:hypothetical protein
MVTPIPVDQSEVTLVWMEHLALAFTVYVPGFAQVFPTLKTPTDNHPEFVPSPQSNWYWIGSPLSEEAPPTT